MCGCVRKFLLFCFGLFFGSLFLVCPKITLATGDKSFTTSDSSHLGGGGFFYPRGGQLHDSLNQVQVSAVVLEQITYFKSESKTEAMTNLDTGTWILKNQNQTVIVARF